MESKIKQPICLISFPHKYTGAQQVPCDLCGAPCYEDPENVTVARESKGYIVCVVCALKIKAKYGLDLNLQGQLWHGEKRKPEPVGDLNKLLIELLERKE
jgi:hypothetical protein